MQKANYKSPYNWIKSSVSSMTSTEEGQPPSNEQEEWQDTHPLSPLRWGTTLLKRKGPLHFHMGDGGYSSSCTCCTLHILHITHVANCTCWKLHVQIARVVNCKCCKLQVLQIASFANCKCCKLQVLQIVIVAQQCEQYCMPSATRLRTHPQTDRRIGGLTSGVVRK